MVQSKTRGAFWLLFGLFSFSQLAAATPDGQNFVARYPQMAAYANAVADSLDSYVDTYLKEQGQEKLDQAMAHGEQLITQTKALLAQRDPQIHARIINGPMFRASRHLTALMYMVAMLPAINYATSMEPGTHRALVFVAVALATPYIAGNMIRLGFQQYADFLTALEGRDVANQKKAAFFSVLARRGYAIDQSVQSDFLRGMQHALAGAGCSKLLTAPGPKVRVGLEKPAMEAQDEEWLEEFAAQAKKLEK